MGVTKDVIREGDGVNFPKTGNRLAMHYKGTLASNGDAFDSSYDRGRPFEFKIGKGEVIKGWDEGVLKMSLGEKAKLLISSDYGYGSEGIGPIPPNADLIFEVELLKIGDMEANIPAEGGCRTIQ
ncbi:peptidyl-prolyl isomerase [Nitzschia inconspicua]|uniref:peptidylprolyl isomerase n=1 Tax=Nitzschia inconspicua TaxID=303405 RepID=A0A9K3KKG5_9STRA|nr:peptidyl-prolyl isomerase [Nitzschia inconspicua]